jgi:Fe-S oxidoreductase
MIEKLLLTAAIAAGLYGFLQPIVRRLRAIQKASRGFVVDQIPRRLSRFVWEVILQGKVIVQRPFAGWMHALVFWGFLIFIPITLEHFGRGYRVALLGHGAFYNILSTIVAVMAVAVLVGIVALLVRRFVARPPALGPVKIESGVVGLLIIILMVTYLLDFVFNRQIVALSASVAANPAIEHSGAGLILSAQTYKLNWWIHSLSILVFLWLIPRSKHLHLVLSPVTTFLKDFELARIKPLDFEKEEFGALTLKDLPAHTALGAFTCVECGRCYDHCPARNTGKLLDPKKLMLDLRDGFLKDPEQTIIGATIEEEVVWQCTTCGACTYQCPVGIDQVVPILETRRGLTAEGNVPHTFNTFFGNLERLQNPWAYPTPQAHEFIRENGYPEYNGQEWLYWMGCLARFDLSYRKVSLAFKSILDRSNVSYGVLLNEQCTGDAARRAGNEFLFQQLAAANIELFKATGVKRIVATCPHCVRTISEYKDLGLDPAVEVIHHSQLINDLVGSGRITLPRSSETATVYHDPCYLSRYGTPADIANPRQLLNGPLEPPRTREKSFCCGAGGAMIFAEETQGKRVNRERTEELLATGADRIAVGCPFCQIMIRDAASDLGAGDRVPVLDVAQVVAERMSN